MENLGSRIKELRISLGLKQGDMPRKMKIGSQKTWSNYETGETFPSNEVFQKLANLLNIDLHWLITGEGSMYRSERTATGKTVFEIPLLTKEQLLTFDPEKEIPYGERKANSGDYPDLTYIPVPMRVMEYSTDLRAVAAFDSRMAPVIRSGDIAIFEATGWGGDGIYLYRLGGRLHISYAGHYDNTFHLFSELEKIKLDYDAQTFKAIGRVRAVVSDLFGNDWKGGRQPPN
jgi:transcriptional regulator with XRE-family HTH domain